jgi:D-psicose/D-tagatose/L-ribulose 3-epimerase
MTMPVSRDIFFSFFMFTANMNPLDSDYTRIVIAHMKELRGQGYAGFDLPIAPTQATDLAAEVESYDALRKRLDDAGLWDVKLSTNVAATPAFDPSSDDPEARERGLDFLKSRVAITKALRGNLMAGPIVLPYGSFPVTSAKEPIWSDALQDWVQPHYKNALPVIEALGQYAAECGVKLAIEPVDHWEHPAPCTANDVRRFLQDVPSRQVGICVDSAHVVQGTQGPKSFAADMSALTSQKRVHAIHVSAPDRGEVADSWIPWQMFLRAVLPNYEGPLLIEVFNAIPVFLNPLRLTRRKFVVPGEDTALGPISAYKVAEQAIATLRRELAEAEETA